MRSLLIKMAFSTLIGAFKDSSLYTKLRPEAIQLYALIQRMYIDDPTFSAEVKRKQSEMDVRGV